MTSAATMPVANDRAALAADGPDGQPARYFFLARGFSRVFWGLLIAVILFFGNAAVEFFYFMKVPAYVAGSGLVAWGLWILPAAGDITPHWRRRVRLTLALVFMQIYFAPFLEWWKLAPQTALYFINLLGLLLASMLVLLLTNLLAADIFRRLGNRVGRIEALAFAWGVVLLMIAPLLLTAAACLLAAFRYESDFVFEMWQIVVQLPIWTYMLLSMPYSLTLIIAWKVKTVCYRRLIDGADGR